MSSSGSVMVAMSGGVDSSVAAAMLVEQGYDVTGVTLKLWGGDSDTGCCSASDTDDARRVADHLGIAHYVFDFTDSFHADVVDPYIADHAAGLTPNPCVECNRTIKFGRLLERVDALGLDLLATGHHARVELGPNGRRQLRRGHDRAKDQSYVLAMLGEAQLARVRFPVGRLTKAEVREHATRIGLRNAAKPDSQDVCFITRGGRREFLREHVGDRAGAFVDTRGAVIGSHDGYARFTIGQRRGLGLSFGERRFVVDVDADSATVTIGSPCDLLRGEISVRDVTFVDGMPVARIAAQTSAHGTPVAARLDGARLVFSTPRQRVAPGQLIAFYDGDDPEVVVGSAVAQ